MWWGTYVSEIELSELLLALLPSLSCSSGSRSSAGGGSGGAGRLVRALEPVEIDVDTSHRVPVSSLANEQVVHTHVDLALQPLHPLPDRLCRRKPEKTSSKQC